MRHPAANFLKYLFVSDPTLTDAQIQKQLEDWGFLTADPTYLPLLRQEVANLPVGFQPTNRTHRPSVRFLRDSQIFEMFHPSEAMTEALELLEDPEKRAAAEQILLARLDLDIATRKVNAKHSWHLTVDGLKMFGHYFWDVKALTFDEWGRFLYNRTAMYDRYMSLLLADPTLSFYHLRLDQTIESKKMIQDTQKIAHSLLLEVSQKPGSGIDKVKSVGILGKIVIEAHNALSTSDMALKDVLKQFEHWRMEHPQVMPPSVRSLAPAGNFSGSGAETKKDPNLN
jgi:hypothetical protein